LPAGLVILTDKPGIGYNNVHQTEPIYSLALPAGLSGKLSKVMVHKFTKGLSKLVN